CSLLTALAPKSSLFPYTTLFRSGVDGEVDAREDLPSLDRGVEVLDLQQRMLAQPTLPSRLIPSNRCASTANSIGSSLKTSLQKPFTIIDTASSAESPRCFAQKI